MRTEPKNYLFVLGAELVAGAAGAVVDESGSLLQPTRTPASDKTIRIFFISKPSLITLNLQFPECADNIVRAALHRQYGTRRNVK